MGTIHWMAPEIFSDNVYGKKSDVYAFAFLIWEIFSRKTPFYYVENRLDIVGKVLYENERPSLEELPKDLNVVLVDMIEINWDRDPVKRDFFRDIVEIFEKIE